MIDSPVAPAVQRPGPTEFASKDIQSFVIKTFKNRPIPGYAWRLASLDESASFGMTDEDQKQAVQVFKDAEGVTGSLKIKNERSANAKNVRIKIDNVSGSFEQLSAGATLEESYDRKFWSTPSNDISASWSERVFVLPIDPSAVLKWAFVSLLVFTGITYVVFAVVQSKS